MCAGRIASAQTVHLKLSGCEVANLKASIAAGEVRRGVRAGPCGSRALGI